MRAKQKRAWHFKKYLKDHPPYQPKTIQGLSASSLPVMPVLENDPFDTDFMQELLDQARARFSDQHMQQTVRCDHLVHIAMESAPHVYLLMLNNHIDVMIPNIACADDQTLQKYNIEDLIRFADPIQVPPIALNNPEPT